MSINSRNKGASEIWKPVWKYEGLYEVSSLEGMVFKYADDDRR